MKKICSLLLLLVLGSCSKNSIDPNYKPIVIAHRGASGYIPEHTLPAVSMAHAFDVDYIEPDVVLSKDNVLVVMHDHTLNTSTDVSIKFPNRKRADGNYYVVDFTLAELKTLIVHERSKEDNLNEAVFPDRFPFNNDVEFRIPTLEEYIITVQGLNKSRKKNIGIAPEVKEPKFYASEGKDVLKYTIELLDKYGYNKEKGNCLLQIFDFDSIKRARTELNWKGDLVMLVEDDEYLLSEEGIKEVAQYANIYSPWLGNLVKEASNTDGYEITSVLDLARKNNLEICVWTFRVDQEPVIKSKNPTQMLDIIFKKLKVDSLFSDQADYVINYLKSNGLRK